MAEEESEWIVEGIVGFLGSPQWLDPVMEFVENKCTVFDDEDENKLSYTDIHQQYKTLVEKLLENYVQEVGISEQQFLDACTSPLARSKTLQSVFQPVLATDDFQMFRSLMLQKNMELQLQALKLIKERNGELPECLTDGVDVMTELQQQEIQILQEVLQKSKEEYEEEMSQRRMSVEEVGSASSVCSSDPSLVDLPAKVNTAEERVRSDPGAGEGGGEGSRGEVFSEKLHPVVDSSSSSSSSSRRRAPGETCLEEAHREAGLTKPFTELSSSQQEQLQQRAAYLRQQRDKLHALKKEQQRSKENISAEETLPTPTAAPIKSPAKCQQRVERTQTNRVCPPPVQKELSVEERKRLQKRKHLADRLKEEVIRK